MCRVGDYSSLQCSGFSLGWLLLLQSTGSRHTGPVVVVHRFSCFTACGIFPDQGWNPGLLHWQVESLPVSHQGSPRSVFLISLSESSVLTYYGITTVFCILILYPATLLNLFYSKFFFFFFMESLGFSIDITCHLQTVAVLHLPFWSECPFFLAQLLWLGLPILY